MALNISATLSAWDPSIVAITLETGINERSASNSGSSYQADKAGWASVEQDEAIKIVSCYFKPWQPEIDAMLSLAF